MLNAINKANAAMNVHHYFFPFGSVSTDEYVFDPVGIGKMCGIATDHVEGS